MNRICVTVLTWNRVKPLKNTLKTLWKYNDPSLFDLIVLDNGSEDETIKMLKNKSVKYFRNDYNRGIFEGTRRLWMYAHDAGYSFVLNLQDDFPCLMTIPFDDMCNYLDSRSDVGFVLLNDKTRLLKVSSSGNTNIKIRKASKRNRNFFTRKRLKYKKWEICGNTKFVRFNHHFTFNPTFVRTSILPGIMTDNPKPRELGIMERYHILGLYAAKSDKRFFETVLRKRHDNWIR